MPFHRRPGLILVIFLMLLQPVIAAEPSSTGGGLAVFGISPSQAEPGSRVVINGTGFQEDVRVWLGGLQITSRLLDSNRLEVSIPHQTAAGQYSLAIRNLKGGRTYAFQVLPLRPVTTGLDPDQVAPCGDRREITVSGVNFLPSSQLLLDGAIIRSRYISSDTITFTVPSALGSGMHQVTVRNGEAAATPVALSVVTAPDIQSITIGEGQVNTYQLLISGSNFSPQSTLLVDGMPIASSALQPRERLVFHDCTRLVYYRQPVISTAKTLRLQVVNPNGEFSAPYEVSAP